MVNSVVIGCKQWEKLVSKLTGLSYSPHVDLSFELFPVKKTLPNPWYGLKHRPYIKGDNDCDDRSKYGYCEIHNRKKRVPIVLVRGRVMGFGQHEFMIVGCLNSNGNPAARYCHRLADGFEWIDNSDVTKVEELW